MHFLVRHTAVVASLLAAMVSARAAADYGGPDGYGNVGRSEAPSHDGYARDDQVVEAADLTNYVIIEAEEGSTEEVDGETIIVVQEPEPIAATSEAPPPSRTVVVEQPAALCAGGIWVDGYWAYSNGQYIWIDGHCVVERVNYVFVHPRWDFYADVWWFVPGYYRPCGVYVGFGYYRPWHWYPPYYHPYYHARRPVPVYRSVPPRPTTVRAAPVGRPPRATPGRPTGPVARPRSAPARSPQVHRPATGPARTGTVRRVDASPSRTSSVRRVDASPNRTGTIRRVDASPSRTNAVTRPATRVAGQRNVVDRPPSSAVRVAPSGRTGPVLTNTAPRSHPQGTIVTQPRTGTVSRGAISRPGASRPGTVSRTGSSSRSSARGSARPGSSSGRSSTVGRPSSAPSRGSSTGRPGFGSSRSSFGRSGGFSRPSSGGFGGGRSVPAARGR